jgi:L-threonylcarbamoyladenylate synthase
VLGLRVPALPDALRAARGRCRGPCSRARRTARAAQTPGPWRRCPAAIRAEADLVLDGGELGGLPSTVVDLRAFEREGTWAVVREGAVATATVAAALGG